MAKQPISLDRFRAQKQEADQALENQPTYGVLVWLHCPTCLSLEYTEVRAPNGRSHRCGTQVEEQEETLDLRAELTLTLANLARIDELLGEVGQNRLKKLLARSMEKTLQALRASESVYEKRLHIAAHGPLLPYDLSGEALVDKLDVADVNPLGLLVSEFRHQPEQRFKPSIP